MLKDNIKTARKQAGKTQKEVALSIGVTESAYCGYETGKRQPDAVKIAAIAAVLGVTGDFLLDLPEKVKPEVLSVSADERALIEAYRAQPEMRAAVRRLLGVGE